MLTVEQLDPPDLARYESTLARAHERRVTIETLTLEGKRAGRLGLSAIDGQITVQAAAADAPSRTLNLRAADKDRVLDFAPESADEGVFFNRLLQVHDARFVDGLGWVTARPFTGAPRTLTRTGRQVDIVAHSKERLAMGSLWRNRTLRKKSPISGNIRSLLVDAGETQLDVPNLRARMPKKRALDRFSTHWAEAFKLAGAVDRQLLYTGPGVGTLRQWPDAPVFVFRTGDGGLVTSEPTIGRNIEGLRNAGLVLGKKPKGKGANRKSAVVRADGIYAPGRWLARNGKPHYLGEKIEDSALRTDLLCRRRGERLLNETLRGIVSASFESGVVPHLESGDMCALRYDGGVVWFRLWEFTIPLAGGTMSVGRVNRHKKRRNRA